MGRIEVWKVRMPFDRRTLILAAAAVCGLAVAGCTETGTEGAQSPSEPGTFAWFELGSDSPEVSRAFYEGVFGWRIKPQRGDEYWTISVDRTPIGGMFAVSGEQAMSETRAQWIPVFAVDDGMDAYRKALSLGARQVAPPAQTSDGLYASIFDPTGAVLDLYQGSSGVPISGSGGAGTWIWADHLSDNPDRAGRFYAALFGTEVGRTADGERVLRLDGRDLAGLVNVPRAHAEPNWLPYVAVADLDATLRAAASRGGRVLTRRADAAILLDPTGAAIGVIAEGADG